MTCEIVKLLSSVLDGTSEVGLLVANDGTVLHLNGPAKCRLFLRDGQSSEQHVTRYLRFFNVGEGGNVGTDDTNDDDEEVHNDKWQSSTQCQVIHDPDNDDASMSVSSSASIANMMYHKLTVTKLPSTCGCCSTQYFSLHVCNKHEKLTEATDASFDPVITIDGHGKITSINQATISLFQYTEDELIGQNISLICGGQHSQQHSKYMSKYMTTGRTKIIGKRREVLAKKKDGTEFYVELGIKEMTSSSSTTSSDVTTGDPDRKTKHHHHHNRYFVGFIRDLTSIKQHELEMQTQMAKIQGMINSSFTPMFEIDETGLITLVNNAACSMFGYTRDEFLNNNISMICGDDHGSRHDEYIKNYLMSGIKKVIGRKRQVKAKRKDGSEFDVELGVQEVILETTVDSSNGKNGGNSKRVFCGFIQDLTQQKKDKRTMRKQQQIIHTKFFSNETGEEGVEKE